MIFSLDGWMPAISATCTCPRLKRVSVRRYVVLAAFFARIDAKNVFICRIWNNLEDGVNSRHGTAQFSHLLAPFSVADEASCVCFWVRSRTHFNVKCHSETAFLLFSLAFPSRDTFYLFSKSFGVFFLLLLTDLLRKGTVNDEPWLVWSFFSTSWPISWTKLALDNSHERRKIHSTTRETFKFGIWKVHEAGSDEHFSSWVQFRPMSSYCSGSTDFWLVYFESCRLQATPSYLIHSHETLEKSNKAAPDCTHCYDCSGDGCCAKPECLPAKWGFELSPDGHISCTSDFYYGRDYLNWCAVSLQPGYRLSNCCWWKKIPRGNCGGAARAPLLFIHFETA